MSENLHNIDKLFKKAIEEHEELPSNNVWNHIDKGLDKNKVVSIQRKYYVLKRVAVAVFIFGFSAGVFAIYFNSRYAKSKSNKETHLRVASDIKSSTKSSTFSSPAASSSSNNSAIALSSTNNNKISKESSHSSDGITGIQGNKRNVVSNNKKSNINHIYNSKQLLELVVKGNNTASSISKDAVKIEATDDTNNSTTQTYSHEMISSAPLLYSFQPTFSISVNRSDIVATLPAPISKLKKQAHLSVIVFGGPQININHLKDEDRPTRPGSRDEFRHSEESMSSVRTGVLFEYPLASNWSIGSGVVYSSSITSIAPKVVFARPDDRGNIKYEFNCSAGYAYIPAKTGGTPLIGDSAKVFNSKSRISYISIPVTAGYNLSSGKFIIKPSVGLLVNFLSNGKVESEISSNSMNLTNSISSISGLKSNYLSGEINLTAVYQLNSKFGIMLSPGSQFALSAINKNTSVKTYPGYIGVTGGVRVAF